MSTIHRTPRIDYDAVNAFYAACTSLDLGPDQQATPYIPTVGTVKQAALGTTCLTDEQCISLTTPGTALHQGINLRYTNTSSPILNTSLHNMRTRQVKAAVFSIERNDKNEIISSTYIKEMWVEVKNGTSLELIVAKHLDKDYNPEDLIVKEIYSISF